jgi:RNA polymerase primary sigma factor
MGNIAVESLSFGVYIREMRKPQYNPLPRSEEEKLATAIHAGSRKALEKLVCANTRFVIKVAQCYLFSGISLEDLISSGNEGLVVAAQRFDASKHVKFISYAVWRIRKRMLALIARQSKGISIPYKMSSMLFPEAQRMELHYEQEHEGNTCPHNMVRDALDVTKVTAASLARIGTIRGRSLNVPCYLENEMEIATITYEDMGDENGAYEDFPKTDCNAHHMLAVKLTRNMLASCNKRDASIMRLFFGIGYRRSYTAVEIGRALNLTHQRVSQIIERQIHLIRRKHCQMVRIEV